MSFHTEVDGKRVLINGHREDYGIYRRISLQSGQSAAEKWKTAFVRQRFSSCVNSIVGVQTGLNPFGQTNRWIVFLYISCVISTHHSPNFSKFIDSPNLRRENIKLKRIVIRLLRLQSPTSSRFLLAVWPLEKSISWKIERNNSGGACKRKASEATHEWLPFLLFFGRGLHGARTKKARKEEGRRGGT